MQIHHAGGPPCPRDAGCLRQLCTPPSGLPVLLQTWPGRRGHAAPALPSWDAGTHQTQGLNSHTDPAAGSVHGSLGGRPGVWPRAVVPLAPHAASRAKGHIPTMCCWTPASPVSSSLCHPLGARALGLTKNNQVQLPVRRASGQCLSVSWKAPHLWQRARRACSFLPPSSPGPLASVQGSPTTCIGAPNHEGLPSRGAGTHLGTWLYIGVTEGLQPLGRGGHERPWELTVHVGHQLDRPHLTQGQLSGSGECETLSHHFLASAGGCTRQGLSPGALKKQRFQIAQAILLLWGRPCDRVPAHRPICQAGTQLDPNLQGKTARAPELGCHGDYLAGRA